jgi:rhodanese-related sulfurtransferase
MSAAARHLARPSPQPQPGRPAASAAAAANRCRCRASSPSSGGSGSGSGSNNGTRLLVGDAQLRATSPAGWEAMRAALREARVAMVAPQELGPLRARGAALVDVRPLEDHASRRIPGAASAPFYRLIAGWSPEQVARRVGFALFGVFKGTEVNPDFLEDVRAALGGAGAGAGAASSSSPSSSAPRVVLYCSQGGSIDAVGAAAAAAAAGPVPGGAGGGARGLRGWQSRSLIAAYALVSAAPGEFGGGRVAVLRGGFSEWARGGREVEGEAAGEAAEEEAGREA